MPACCGERPRKNQNPAAATIMIAALAAAINPLNLRAGAVAATSLTFPDGAAIVEGFREAGPAALAEGGTDGVGDEGTTGASSKDAVFPDSVSRFNRCKSARMSAAL